MANTDPRRPFNKLPLLPPKAKLETPTVLKLCIEARVSLERLMQLGKRVPNQAVLIDAIPILEARDSSAIENIVTTTDKLFEGIVVGDHRIDPATKEALRYRTALRRGFDLLQRQPVSTRTAVDVCNTIRGMNVGIRQVPGTKLANEQTGETIYTPPQGESLIRDLLANWERFLHTEIALDPLVRMAAAHYQFEAIHPFTDGNGRTGRILNLLYLCDKELLEQPVLYLSSYILHTRQDYYRLLRAVTNSGQWGEWIEYMLHGVRTQAIDTAKKIQAILRLQDETAEYVRHQLPSVYSYELVETLFIQPYCRIRNLVEAGICKRQTASAYLRALCDSGLVEELVVGREKLFINVRYMELLSSREHEFTPFPS